MSMAVSVRIKTSEDYVGRGDITKGRWKIQKPRMLVQVWKRQWGRGWKELCSWLEWGDNVQGSANEIVWWYFYLGSSQNAFCHLCHAEIEAGIKLIECITGREKLVRKEDAKVRENLSGARQRSELWNHGWCNCQCVALAKVTQFAFPSSSHTSYFFHSEFCHNAAG